MAINPPHAKGDRELDITARITLSDGWTIIARADRISSFTVHDSPGNGAGLALGSTAAASFSLTLYNAGRAWTPAMFDDAEVHMFVTIDGSEMSMGVWYVDSVNAPEQSVYITLNGADALKTRFTKQFNDAKGNYNSGTTIHTILTRACLAAGIPIARNDYPNAAVKVTSMPKWPNEVTLRQVIGYIAACAGGFAHITRDGRLDIVGYHDAGAWTLGPDLYKSFTATGGQEFHFNSLRVKLPGKKDYTSYKVNTSLAELPTNTIELDDNPLYTAAIAQSVVTELRYSPVSEAGTVSWGGDPAVLPGDTLTVTDLNGNAHVIMVLSQSWSFDGGLACTESCQLPTLAEHENGYSTAGSVFDSSGNVKATHVSGLDDSIVYATAAHFADLTAADIKADSLISNLISATQLWAKSIDAGEIATDILTAATADIIDATIRKIKAGTISTDELYAGLAEIQALKVGSLTADSITTDSLAAAIANFTVLTAGTATFDKATVTHLISELLTVKEATADKVFISNLAVDYANILTANVANLCVKAADGNYYQLHVDEDGNVTGKPTSVSPGEIAAGVTTGGSTIMDTNVIASDLTATNLKAVRALIDKLDASRIDVATLVAQDAYVEHLHTADLSANESLRIAVEAGENTARYMTFDDKGLTQRVPGSVYYTQVDNYGFYVKSDEEVKPLATMNASDGIKADKMRLGLIRCRATSKGGWAWQIAED